MIFEAHYTKFRQLMLAVLGLGIAAAGVWMLVQTAADVEGNGSSRLASIAAMFGVSALSAVHVIGLILLVTGIAVLPFVMINLRHKGPAIRVSAGGIYVHRWSETPIPWSNVAKIAPYTVQGQKMVGVTLIDPALNKKSGVFARFGNANRVANRALGFGDLALVVQGTDGKYDDLVEALLAHADQFG